MWPFSRNVLRTEKDPARIYVNLLLCDMASSLPSERTIEASEPLPPLLEYGPHSLPPTHKVIKRLERMSKATRLKEWSIKEGSLELIISGRPVIVHLVSVNSRPKTGIRLTMNQKISTDITDVHR